MPAHLHVWIEGETAWGRLVVPDGPPKIDPLTGQGTPRSVEYLVRTPLRSEGRAKTPAVLRAELLALARVQRQSSRGSFSRPEVREVLDASGPVADLE